MSMDLFIARTVVTKATLVFRGPIDVTEFQVGFPFIILSYNELLLSLAFNYLEQNSNFC